MQSKALIVVLPVLFVLMAIEAAVARHRRGDTTYRLPDTVASVGVGIGYFALTASFSFISIVAYDLVYDRWAIARHESSTAAILVAIVAADFLYYVFHRASHRINVLWAIHVVHHQSREQNLAVNLRMPWLQPVYQWLFYLPLAFLGLPPAAFVAARGVSTAYNILTHTRAVGKLGPLEYVLNTPSHHRVHHGMDEQYLDCNYGGIFIVWDRLFGTFVPEGKEPTYGTRREVVSWNPIWLNVEPFVHLAKLSRAAREPWDRVKVWFMPPEWLPAGAVGSGAPPGPREAEGRESTAASIARMAFSVGITMIVFAMLIATTGTSMTQKLALLVLLLASLGAHARSLERPGAGAGFEIARAAVLLAVAAWFGASSARPLAGVALAAGGLSALSGLLFRLARRPGGPTAGEVEVAARSTSLSAGP
ncbi:sterol desaturase family protein [Sorangium sp. So ce1036]|uniref:sterol desaturase family protein n=1 Tax=Sorangium sp. So ce1036 TaxID=3133328 RepID=UPI003F05E8E9